MRPAAHADAAYPSDPDALREQLDAFFLCDGGPGPIDVRLRPTGRPPCGILSPHIDPPRGGAAYAWAYKTLVEQSDADVFVIFGTAHNPMQQPFCVSRKDFDTPLGTVRSDQAFIERMAEHLTLRAAGRCLDPFADELAQRLEHSIEFQVLFLQYMLGPRRDFRIVPILAGARAQCIEEERLPADTPQMPAFRAAVRAAAAAHAGRVCYISGADLAHIGTRFGDAWPIDDDRLAAQSADDRALLAAALRGDSAGFFRHVARQDDRGRICGLAPTYAMLEVLGPVRGELLHYDQAVEPDGSACVTFASAAFYPQ